MAETNIDSTSIGDMQGTITNYSVPSETLDSPIDQKETYYENNDWPKQLGYYKKIPELKASIDAMARWTVGKGFTSNEITELALMQIKGWGKETFNTILENQIRVSKIGGDSFAEIIRDDDGKLVNLKPISPQFMRIVANKKGLIIRYEQLDRYTRKEVQKFQPEEIFHLSRDRVADEIHGVSLVDAVEEIILMRNEAMQDYKKLLHRNVFPVRVWEVDTDDTGEIATFKAKADLVSTQGENIVIPKGSVTTEVSAVPSNATLNPLPWINQLNQYFFQATGVPQIIVGGAQEITEASAKIAYMAWQQVVEEEQLYVEEQVLNQLNLEIELNFPTRIENELISDEQKDGPMSAATKEDMTVTGAIQ